MDQHLITRIQLDSFGTRLRPDTVSALLRAVDAAEADPRCRALVLYSSGTAFCTGVGLHYLANPDDWPWQANAELWQLLTRLTESRLVTLAAVDGDAQGGGVGLAAACDFVVAGPHANFRLTELLIGLVPAVVMPFLSARLGSGASFRSTVLAERIDAESAVRLGLADEQANAPEDSVRRLALALRRMPRDAVADLKACRRRLLSPTEEESYLRAADAMFRAAADDDAVQARVRALRTHGVK